MWTEPVQSPIQSLGERPLSTKVCVLAPEHAEALEERGIIPNCQCHIHFSHNEADRAIAAERANRQLLEGYGTMRTVHSIDGRRRVTPVATSTVLPLFKVQNKLQKPKSINYPIPACGARSRPQWNHQINFVPPYAEPVEVSVL